MNDPDRVAFLHPTVFVAPGAVVLGDVTLHARASVWFNTVIRGDSAKVIVGEETNLQDNSVVHEDEGFPALIGARVTVGHRSIVHGCVIEDDCLIGMGSVLLSGARIGTGSLVGAASLVREHQVIPPGSLVVGSPARVVGPVTDAHRAAIRNGSTHYAALARRYMMSGMARGATKGGAVTESHGPMTHREWRELLSRLGEAPSAVRAHLDLGDASSESLRERAWRDLAVRLPAIAALGDSDLPVLNADSPAARGVGTSTEEAFESWHDARRALLERLETLGPNDWKRPIGHPTRGARTVADWLREWVDQDLEQGRKLVAGRQGRT